MKKIFFLFIAIAAIVFACSKEKPKEIDTPNKGEITVETDESFKSVIEALAERYMALNPQTKINVVIKKEDLGLLDLLDRKVRIAVMSRELSQKEKEAYDTKIDLPWLPGKFAADAVLFVVPKDSPLESISMDDIYAELKSDKKRLIFDGTNSSNLNFIAQKFKKDPSQLKFSIINGNENVAEQLKNYPDKIGVISYNTISRPFGEEAQRLRNDLKILKVVKENQAYDVTGDNLKNMTYPFTRVLYFVSNEAYYGLGNGFIRFSCQQLGQIVVEKEGLQPYNIFKREVRMK
ncbi:PstS family phosphate ABC transporter substrate-binding protein [Epilithonimonas lactis]|uniref:Phosphate ABC transporter substrate-binding protein n=1 Tax=Epilithonimonas lactis TaxID=421072 RepID=A0A085BED1_9FLAO|nr:substrate-binding domain-containing protein [Epilithonimonas lactis]KFC20826.1 phosphate ABC transporter substrate-binding protein [Epilithonimonas lactis]SEP62925.1 phosphate ABC transporter substrate-binding protein, PhoT family [Epilithonimonas lactis]